MRLSWDRRHLPRAGIGWAWPAVVLLLILLAAGCGGSDGDTSGVASVSGNDGATTTTTGGADREQALLAFARCMREHGVPMDDPQVDSDGNLRLRPGQGGVGDVDQATLDKAREACQEHLEGVTQGFTPEDQTRLQDSLVKYAGCMRKNGYDMPDPDLSQGAGRGRFGDLDRDTQSCSWVSDARSCLTRAVTGSVPWDRTVGPAGPRRAPTGRANVT